ncbi:MAG: DNA repair protein RecO [Waddliaceae bacterium]
MQTKTTEGIILKTGFLKNSDLLLEVFTLDYGLMRLAYKGGNSYKRKRGGTTLTLTRAEIVFAEGKTGLSRCIEISPVNFNLDLRNSYRVIQAAGLLAHLIRRTQMENKPAPSLYALFLAYLKRLPQSQNLEALVASFRLKLLRHEGLFNPNSPPALITLAASQKFSEIEGFTMTKEISDGVQFLFSRELS